MKKYNMRNLLKSLLFSRNLMTKFYHNFVKLWMADFFVKEIVSIIYTYIKKLFFSIQFFLVIYSPNEPPELLYILK